MAQKGRYTKYSNKIGLYSTSKGSYVQNDTDVVLNFPFKDTILEAGMSKEDVGREERFLHQELDSKDIDTLEEPKVLTDFRYLDKNGERPLDKSSNVSFFDDSGELAQNLLINGNNLLALYSLRERLAGKVKIIYIDPPYNTKGDANTFTYNNTFNHSAWLAFMKNRIEIAKELLRDDGVLAITIDDEEQAYLTVLCDEIFGRENKMGVLAVQIKPSGRTTDTYLSTSHEYALFYSKKENAPSINFLDLDETQKAQYKNTDESGNAYKWRDFLRTGGYSTPEERPNSYYPIYFNPETGDITVEKQSSSYVEILPIDSEGKHRVWRKTKPSLNVHIEAGEIKVEQVRGVWKVRIIDRIKEGVRPKSVWTDSKYDSATYGTKLLKQIFGGDKLFSFPKSLYATLDVLKMFSDGDDDIILDFFAGSGTTAHAVLELNKQDNGNRRFVAVEQMGYIEAVTKERLKKVINTDYRDASFVFLALKKYNQEYIDGIMKATSLSELEDLYVDMRNNAFLKFWFDRNEFEKDENFRKLDIEQRKQKLIDVLDENQLYLNYADMNDTRHEVSEDEKALTDKFYGTAEN